MIGILGLGNMGQAATYFAAKSNMGIRAFDCSLEQVNNTQRFLDNRWEKGEISKVDCIHLDKENELKLELLSLLTTHHAHKNFSIIFSCLPYHQNLSVADWCIQHKVTYCDLGGSVEVSEKIKELSKDSKKPIMTDLGLAPGLVSFYALNVLKKCPTIPRDMTLYCGGLPASHLSFGWPKMNALRYTLTWNQDGLYNEYVSPCKILVNGEIRIEKALDGVEKFNTECEAFLTSGGIAHLLTYLQKVGVKNVSYKTLRYKGHLDIVKMLLENMSEEEFKRFIIKACPKKDDQVSIHIRYSWYDNGVNTGEFSKVIFSDPTWSAMQKATAIPAVAAINCIRDGYYNLTAGKYLQYEDIVLNDYLLEIARLGL